MVRLHIIACGCSKGNEFIVKQYNFKAIYFVENNTSLIIKSVSIQDF